MHADYIALCFLLSFFTSVSAILTVVLKSHTHTPAVGKATISVRG